MQLEIEEDSAEKRRPTGLSQETARASAGRTGRTAGRIQHGQKAQWDNEKIVGRASTEDAGRDRSRSIMRFKKAQQRVRSGDRAAELQYGQLPQLKKQLEEEEEPVKEKETEPWFMKRLRMKKSHGSSPDGPESRLQNSTRVRGIKRFIWRKNCTNV